MYSEGVEEETYLRSVQIAEDPGIVTFSSIFPGCCAGRWPGLHVEVFLDAESIVDAGNAILTSQIALPEGAWNEVLAREEYAGSAENLAQLTLKTDGIFADGVDQQLAAARAAARTARGMRPGTASQASSTAATRSSTRSLSDRILARAARPVA